MLGKYGKNKRRFTDEFGTRYEIDLQKFKCSQCGEYYVERPDCFERRKQYLKVIVEKVKNGEELPRNTGPGKATLSRWRREGQSDPE